jgi:isoquinoline 1-oxidoreductase subunit alpha
MKVALRVNGKTQRLDTEPEMPLLWVLRDQLDMTGTKFGCGAALCGACTVLVNGMPTRSCVMPASSVQGAAVTTIEGLTGREADAVRRAWRELDVVQCGWCQSGQIVAATALLRTNKKPNDTDIDGALDANLCRCGTYQRVRQAVHAAAAILAAGAKS